jgi:hypothetical protein
MFQPKIESLRESIKMQDDIMIESQASIRQAHATLERMNIQYKRALEQKIHLQERLIEELQKPKKEETK